MELHRGTQCSSCGLRFKEANNENYRQHLDWHFRINRKEKETQAAHRNWFITTDVSICSSMTETQLFYNNCTPLGLGLSLPALKNYPLFLRLCDYG